MKRTFRALSTVVAVTWDDALPSASLVEMLIGGYATVDEPSTLEYVLASDRVARDGFVRVVDDPLDVAPVFELDLYQQIVEHASPGWVLHAAALDVGGKTIVLAGPSGAGKTTLTLALVATGARILTEEMVLIDRDLLVRGLARPLHLDGLPAPVGWRHHPYPMRGPGGRTISAPPIYVTEPRKLDSLIRIEHGVDLVPIRARLSPSTAISQFWSCTLRQDDDGLAVAVHCLGLIRPELLKSHSVQSAITLLIG